MTFEEILRSDPLAQAVIGAMARASTTADRKRVERLIRRRMFGGCQCGYVRGEDYCPFCDDGKPTAADIAAREQQQAARREAVQKAFADIDAAFARPKVDGAPSAGNAPRAPNRFERRRAASRRWRG